MVIRAVVSLLFGYLVRLVRAIFLIQRLGLEFTSVLQMVFIILERALPLAPRCQIFTVNRNFLEEPIDHHVFSNFQGKNCLLAFLTFVPLKLLAFHARLTVGVAARQPHWIPENFLAVIAVHYVRNRSFLDDMVFLTGFVGLLGCDLISGVTRDAVHLRVELRDSIGLRQVCALGLEAVCLELLLKTLGLLLGLLGTLPGNSSHLGQSHFVRLLF